MMEGLENEMRISSGTGSFNPMDTVSKVSRMSKNLASGLPRGADSPHDDAISDHPSFKTQNKL